LLSEFCCFCVRGRITNRNQVRLCLGKSFCIIKRREYFKLLQPQVRAFWLSRNCTFEKLDRLIKFTVGDVNIRFTDRVFGLTNSFILTIGIFVGIQIDIREIRFDIAIKLLVAQIEVTEAVIAII
jgi:hypothetical protein